jgi:sugar phosphate isomerase/epimerase
LHQITVNDQGPAGLVEIAARLGCTDVCLFTHIPEAALPGDDAPTLFPVVGKANLALLQAALRDHDIMVGNIEFFPVRADGEIEIYREAFAMGAAIGAARAVTHIHDSNDGRAVDTLGRLCDLAAEYDLRLGLEFMGLTPDCASIQRGIWFVEQVGRRNIGIGVDALHLIRTGGTPRDVLAAAPEVFTYAQICDAPGLGVTNDYLHEALERSMPGDGDFPLEDFVAALPADIAIDVEVPSIRRIDAGLPALDYAREAVRRSGDLLGHLARDRD